MIAKKILRKMTRWFDRLDLEVKIIFSILVPICFLFIVVYLDLLYRWMVVVTGGVFFLLLNKIYLIANGGS